MFYMFVYICTRLCYAIKGCKSLHKFVQCCAWLYMVVHGFVWLYILQCCTSSTTIVRTRLYKVVKDLRRLYKVLVPSFPGVSSVKIVVSCSYLVVKAVVVRVSWLSNFLGVISVVVSLVIIVGNYCHNPDVEQFRLRWFYNR